MFDDLLIDDEPETEGFVITTLDEAAWASRQIAYAQRKADEYKEWAKREKAKIDEAVAEEVSRYEKDTEFFLGALAYYHEAEMRTGRKTKSLNLPGGTFRRTKRAPKINYDTSEVEQSIIEKMFQEAPETVRVKKSLIDREFRKAVEFAVGGVVVLDGEIIDGVMWEEQEDSVSFSLPKEE